MNFILEENESGFFVSKLMSVPLTVRTSTGVTTAAVPEQKTSSTWFLLYLSKSSVILKGLSSTLMSLKPSLVIWIIESLTTPGKTHPSRGCVTRIL